MTPKLIIFLATLFIFIICIDYVHSQVPAPQYSDDQIYQYDSVKYSSFNNGSWQMGVVIEKIQDSSGSIFMDSYNVNFDSSRTLRARDIYIFDSSNMLDTIYQLSNGGSIGSPLDTVRLRILDFASNKKLRSDTSYFNNNGVWELQNIESYTYDSLDRTIEYLSYASSQNATIRVITFDNNLNYKKDSVSLQTPGSTIFWGIDNTEYGLNGKINKYFFVSPNMDTTITNSFFYNSQNLLDSVFLDFSFPTAFKYEYDSTGEIMQFVRYTVNNSIFSKSSLEEYFFSDLGAVISSFETYHSLKVFPNPTKDVLHFAIENSASNEYQIDIFNINGLKIKSERGSSAQPSININELNFGIYIYELNLNRETYRGKIIHK